MSWAPGAVLESLQTLPHFIFMATLQGSVNSMFEMKCCCSERLNELLKVMRLIRGEAGITLGLSDSKLCSLYYTMLNLYDWIWNYDLYRIYIFSPWAQGLFDCLLLFGPQLPSLMMPKNLIDIKFISTLEAMNKFMNHTSNDVKRQYVVISKYTGLIKLVLETLRTNHYVPRILYPFYRYRHWGFERLGNLLKAR